MQNLPIQEEIQVNQQMNLIQIQFDQFVFLNNTYYLKPEFQSTLKNVIENELNIFIDFKVMLTSIGVKTIKFRKKDKIHKI